MILVNGTGVEPDEPVLPVADRGFLLGDGIFTTLRIKDQRPLLLERHLARLEAAAKVFRLHLDLDKVREEAARAARSVEGTYGSMRISVSRGAGPRGLVPPETSEPVRVIGAYPAGPRTGHSIDTIISEHPRNEHSVLSSIKSLSYQEQVLARMEAADHGAGDAIMLNTQGQAASTSMANLLAYQDGQWVTPPVTAGILPGVVRGVLLETGLVIEGSIDRASLSRLVLGRSNSLIGAEPLALRGGADPDPAATARLTEALEVVESRER